MASFPSELAALSEKRNISDCKIFHRFGDQQPFLRPSRRDYFQKVDASQFPSLLTVRKKREIVGTIDRLVTGFTSSKFDARLDFEASQSSLSRLFRLTLTGVTPPA